MDTGRTIGWAGFFNARDLGNLRTRDGRLTRPGALIRSADLRFVTEAGWQEAHKAGIRTVLDLRNDDEVTPQTGPGLTALGGSAQFPASASGAVAPAGMERIQVPLDGVEDTAFWQYLNTERLNGTPLYFRPFLEQKPERCAAVITAIARAQPGGVIFHCAAGRDRTGIIAMLLLALADVEPATIATDYTLSAQPLRALYAAMGREDDGPALEQILAIKGTTARQAIESLLNGLNVENYLLAAGVTPENLSSVKNRLLG